MTGHDNDPFEEFKFKPLTDGLGFHRKGTQQQTRPSRSLGLSQNIFNSTPLPEIEESQNPLKSPVPRKTATTAAAGATATSTTTNSHHVVDEILKSLQKNKQAVTELPKAQAELKKATQQTHYKADTPSLSAFSLDALLVMAASLLCFIILLVVTQVDLVANIMNPDTQGQIYLSSASVVLTVSFIYYLVHRAFLGFTPGEWAYDQRLGQPKEMTEPTYILRVMARWVLVTMTGIITLPLISKITGKDLAGEWLDLPLLRQE